MDTTIPINKNLILHSFNRVIEEILIWQKWYESQKENFLRLNLSFLKSRSSPSRKKHSQILTLGVDRLQ